VIIEAPAPERISVAPWQAEPYRLWSLLDIMKPFHPATYLTAIRMAETIIRATLPEEQWPALRMKAQSVFTDAEEFCTDLGLTASIISVHKILRLLSKDACSYERFRELVGEFQERIIDEMSAPQFFAVSDQEARYYNEPRNGWQEIIDRFPGTLDDVEEASKCFALSRYTAAVFHSIQVVELGLIELGTFIQVPDPKSGWTAVASELKKLVSKRYEDRTLFEKQNLEFLEQVQGTVEGLKNAWRNKISHAQGKLILMTAVFNAEVAEEILFATRAFMRRLATGLPARSP
jgi:hypothetical protein